MPRLKSKRLLLALIAGTVVVILVALAKVGFPPSGMWESCYTTLEDIDIAKRYWALENNRPPGSAVVLSDLYPRYLRDYPRCPRGGAYTVGKTGELPFCSVRGSPWHERHYFLNYCREEFVTGKRVRFAGRARNVNGKPVVDNGQKLFVIEGFKPWSLLQRNRKVTVFGVLSNGFPHVINSATYERGYFVSSSFAHCITIAKQVDGSKSLWEIEKRKTDDDKVQISELFQLGYFQELPHCDSGGVYIIESIDKRPTCTLHGDVLQSK